MSCLQTPGLKLLREFLEYCSIAAPGDWLKTSSENLFPSHPRILYQIALNAYREYVWGANIVLRETAANGIRTTALPRSVTAGSVRGRLRRRFELTPPTRLRPKCLLEFSDALLLQGKLELECSDHRVLHRCALAR